MLFHATFDPSSLARIWTYICHVRGVPGTWRRVDGTLVMDPAAYFNPDFWLVVCPD